MDPDMDNFRELHIAILQNNRSEVERLLALETNDWNKLKERILLISVNSPAIAQMLIKRGANINTTNLIKDTPLHIAVILGETETVSLLLYYYAEPNVENDRQLTPFMYSLKYGHVNLQKMLIEYVVDFKAKNPSANITRLAVKYNSPLIEEILSKGGEVTTEVLESFRFSEKNFKLFVFLLNNTPPCVLSTLSIWKNMFESLSKESSRETLGKYINVILETFERLNITTVKPNLSIVSIGLLKYLKEWQVDSFAKFICFYLIYEDISLETISKVYDTFGYCDLLLVLLHFNVFDPWNKDKYLANPINGILSIYMYFIDIDILYICNKVNETDNLKVFKHLMGSMKYWAHPNLLALIQRIQVKYFPSYCNICSSLPNFPSLIELARDQTRKYLVNLLKMKNASAYYEYLKIFPDDIKNILTFRKELYCFEM